MAGEPLLQLAKIRSGYDEIEVLKGVDLDLEPGTVTAVIGANGAGKSTLLKTIFGLVETTSGRIIHEGADITELRSRQRLARGVVIVPQGRCNFPLLTVEENLVMGAYIRDDSQVQADVERALERFPVVGERRHTLAGNMSGGEQQLLEMAMALMLSPSVVLIDEPSLGLSPAMQSKVFGAIRDLRGEGTAVLLVEQNAVQALETADRGVVIERGKVAYEGSGVAMLDDSGVRRAYLGLAV